MSHPANDEFLEYAKNEFEGAETREEREAVVQRLRDEGFTSQADHLEQFVEDGGVDRSDELREREQDRDRQVRESHEPRGHGTE